MVSAKGRVWGKTRKNDYLLLESAVIEGQIFVHALGVVMKNICV